MSTLCDLISIVDHDQLDTQGFADALKHALGSELEPEQNSFREVEETQAADAFELKSALESKVKPVEVIEVEESLPPASNTRMLRVVRSDASTILDDPSDSEPARKQRRWETVSEAVYTEHAETGCVSYRMRFKNLPFKCSAVETVRFAVSDEDELTEIVFGVRQ